MCPSAPRVCSEPGGQRQVLSLSLDLIDTSYAKSSSNYSSTEWINLCNVHSLSVVYKEVQKVFKINEIRSPLTHCGLVMPYGDIYLGQASTWTNVNSHQRSKAFCGNHLTASLVLMNLICKLLSEIKLLKLLPHLPVANELTDNCSGLIQEILLAKS